MDETHQYPYDDEINLVDLIEIIWENKAIVILGTIFAALIGIGVNLILPNVYRASMVLKPGILEVDSNRNETTYIDSPENIKAAIDLGSYDSRIIKLLSKDAPKMGGSKISYTVNIPKNTDVVKISTDQTSGEKATKILATLINLLEEEYRQKIDLYMDRFRIKIETLQGKIGQQELEIARRQDYVDRTEANIEELSDNLNDLVQYGKRLSGEKSKTPPVGDNKVMGLIYKDFEISQNVAMIRDLKEAINNHQLSRIDEMEKLQALNSNIFNMKSELDQLTIAMNNIQNIQTLQPPETATDPVKPKKARNVAVAVLAGLFLSILFVFIKQAIRTKQTQNLKIGG
jgi:LPS O-antigen subunit length determinant protein (WzzB/FepE family)